MNIGPAAKHQTLSLKSMNVLGTSDGKVVMQASTGVSTGPCHAYMRCQHEGRRMVGRMAAVQSEVSVQVLAKTASRSEHVVFLHTQILSMQRECEGQHEDGLCHPLE